MFIRGCCSTVLKCRVPCFFVFVLLFLVIVNFDECACMENGTRIFKREVLDGNLQAYLTNFGYMPKSADGAFALRTEESIREAIREMQAFAGIPVSGKLDEKTVKLMRTPRCGLPDRDIRIVPGRRKRYAIHGSKWPYTDLTWSLRTKQFSSDLDPNQVRFVISKALDVWSKHSKLTFTEVDSDKADILIYFYRRDHGDNFPFDGKGVILAHAFFPTGKRSSVDVHFDADENWTTAGSSEKGTNLFNVAAHEIGHSLGLSHSDVEGALMYPWYTEMKDGFDYELPDDDKLAIQYLYGTRDHKQWERRPHYRPQAPPTTTTTTTTTTRPTTRVYHRYPYDPRYPQGKNPYSRPDKSPHKPMHPDKKPHYPKHNHNGHGTDRRYPHHRYPTTENNHPTVTTPPYHKPTRHVPKKYPQTPQRSPERATPESPKEYPNNPPPDTCDTSYDAVAVIRRELFIFKDRYFWRISDNGLVTNGYPAEITRQFRGFPRNLTHVDAVYERPDGNIVFFIGRQYYVFSGVSVMSGYPKPITELGISSNFDKIDGAMVWGHNGRTYFFSGAKYWRFDEDEQKVELDYPRSIVAMWKGVGTNIDAVFQWKDGRTYFFKGKGFWKFNDLRMRVDHEEQKLSAPVWMGCKQNYEQNDLNQKLPYTNLSSSSIMMTFDRWIMGVIGWLMTCRMLL